MRNVTRESITEVVTRSFDGLDDARAKLLITRLIAHLHAYAREVNLTPGEWKTAIDFLYAAGRKSDEGRNEFILASDVLGLSALIDMLQTGPGSTDRSLLGPFHAAASPPLEVDGDLARANSGEKMLVRGRVLGGGTKPLAGATLDFWQAAANGLYWQQDAAQDRNNLRCTMRTADDGAYAFTTVRPAPYQVPYDGPVGDLLRAAGRHAWRPAHLHFIVSADAHRALTTEVFFADDPYVDRDAVFGVREGLVVEVQPSRNDALARRYALPKPFPLVEFDFNLAPERK
ncbi:MAG TPA: dioxygenase [Burkholderiales bacterium]|nr:dioxygenase [Burkholderiales bacterium]